MREATRVEAMTVGDLVLALRRLPPDSPVLAESYDQLCLWVMAVMAVDDWHGGPAVVVRTSAETPDQLY